MHTHACAYTQTSTQCTHNIHVLLRSIYNYIYTYTNYFQHVTEGEEEWKLSKVCVCVSKPINQLRRKSISFKGSQSASKEVNQLQSGLAAANRSVTYIHIRPQTQNHIRGWRENYKSGTVVVKLDLAKNGSGGQYWQPKVDQGASFEC